MSQIGLGPFFAAGDVRQLQLNSLNIATMVVRWQRTHPHWCRPQVFSRYKAHREAMVEEILVSISSMPGSKRHARQYRYL